MTIKSAKIKANVGRVRNTANTPGDQAAYIKGINTQLNNIISNFQSVVDALQEQAPEVLIEALQPAFDLSQEYVPVDTGDLKASGFLREVKDNRNPTVAIGYASAGNPSYAAFVHERVDINHAAPTRSKYLLAALEEKEEEVQQGIIIGFYKALGGKA